MTVQPVAFVWFLVAAVLGLEPAALQSPTQIVGPAACAECGLDMTLEVTLRDRPDLGKPIVASTRIVVRDAQDRILVVHGQDLARIQVFAPDGTFVKSLGGPGQAPGEFGSISALALGAGGDLYAFDWRQQRVTVFSPDFEVIETVRLPLRVRQAVFGSGRFTVAARAFSDELVGLPLHFLTSDLTILGSFGATDETVRPDMPTLQHRLVTSGSDGRIWSAKLHSYLVEEWDPSTGTRHRAFERLPEWFTPWLVSTSVTLEVPPQSRLVGIWQDAEGLLWTVTIVAGDSWGEGLYAPPGWGGDLMIEDPERVYDSYVEVIDPSAGRLLLSQKVPQFLAGFTNDGLMFGIRSPDDDVPQIELWRVKLVR